MSLSKISLGAALDTGPDIWAQSLRKTGSGDQFDDQGISIAIGTDRVWFATVTDAAADINWGVTDRSTVIFQVDKNDGTFLDIAAIEHGINDQYYFEYTTDAIDVTSNGNMVYVGYQDNPNSIGLKLVSVNQSFTKQREVAVFGSLNTREGIVCVNSDDDVMVAVGSQATNAIDAVAILNDAGSWANAHISGNFISPASKDIQSIKSLGTDFYVSMRYRYSTLVPYSVGFEKYTGTGTSANSIILTVTGAASNDQHWVGDFAIDHAGNNIYLVWQYLDIGTPNVYYWYISKIALGSSPPFSHTYTKRIVNAASANNLVEVSICVMPDDSGAVACFRDTTDNTINLCGVNSTAKTIDLEIIGNETGDSDPLVRNCRIASDTSRVYLTGLINDDAAALQYFGILGLKQAALEAWTTEAYGVFDSNGTSGKFSFTDFTSSVTADLNQLSERGGEGIDSSAFGGSATTNVVIDTAATISDSRTEY